MIEAADDILAWDRTGVVLTKIVPSLAKWRFNRILARRLEAEVAGQWQRAGFDYVDVSSISQILADACEWKNGLFLPNDPCSIVVWRSGICVDHMEDIAFFYSLEQEFEMLVDIPSNLEQMRYEELVSHVLCHIQRQ